MGENAKIDADTPVDVLLRLLNDAAQDVAQCGGDRDVGRADREQTQLKIDAIFEAIERLGRTN